MVYIGMGRGYLQADGLCREGRRSMYRQMVCVMNGEGLCRQIVYVWKGVGLYREGRRSMQGEEIIYTLCRQPKWFMQAVDSGGEKMYRKGKKSMQEQEMVNVGRWSMQEGQKVYMYGEEVVDTQRMDSTDEKRKQLPINLLNPPYK